MQLDELKYPIGNFKRPENISKEILNEWISVIAQFPDNLRREVSNLTDVQLDTNYRPGGWTIRQLVHHCADSHINSFIRFKLALTEENPTIKPYFEERWAELSDSKKYPIEPSLKIISGIHERWAALLNGMKDKDMERSFFHPEQGRAYKLSEATGIYAWHCRHHLAHITSLKKGQDW